MDEKEKKPKGKGERFQSVLAGLKNFLESVLIRVHPCPIKEMASPRGFEPLSPAKWLGLHHRLT